jgi:drug/metabolite transporter (DMT)-like permease
MEIPKLGIKAGVIISLMGIGFIVVGSLKQEYLATRLAGVIIATAGLVTLGKRVYERTREISRLKHKARG